MLPTVPPLPGRLANGAEQLAVLPPLVPLQFHPHDELPAVTWLALPVVQRRAAGVNAVAVLDAVPHAPFTGAAVTAAVAAEQTSVPVRLPALATGVTQKYRWFPISAWTGV